MEVTRVMSLDFPFADVRNGRTIIFAFQEPNLIITCSEANVEHFFQDPRLRGWSAWPPPPCGSAHLGFMKHAPTQEKSASAVYSPGPSISSQTCGTGGRCCDASVRRAHATLWLHARDQMQCLCDGIETTCCSVGQRCQQYSVTKRTQ